MSGRANRSPIRSRTVKIGITVAVGVTVLAGCAAGQNAETAQEKSVIDGVNASSGNISLNDLSVSAPADGGAWTTGQDAPLQVVIVNNGPSVDTLTSVTVDASVAKSVLLSPDTVATPSFSATPLSSPGATASDGDSGSVSATATSPGAPSTDTPSVTPPEAGGTAAPSDTATTTPTSTAPTSTPIAIPVASSVRVGLPGAAASIVLNDLTGPLYPAQEVTLVFSFSNGETISALTNVHLAAGDSTAPTLAVTQSGDT